MPNPQRSAEFLSASDSPAESVLVPCEPIQSDHVLPLYSQNFHCIGSACEDTCCQGWSVPVDQASYEKYQQLPASPLRNLMDACILRTPVVLPILQEEKKPKPATYARIEMTAQNQCPLLTKDQLCGIQAEFGEEYLSHTCATYPRIRTTIGGMEETALTLSCPEAARLVLLTPSLLDVRPANQTALQNPIQEAVPESASALHWFWKIRETVLALVCNRSYPLWQRMFLLGIFCRRMDSIAKGELKRTVPGFLEDFKFSVASGGLRVAMETLPVDRLAQLDAVLRLAGLLLHRSNVRPRFVESVQWFTTGIGNGPTATLESLADHYDLAYDRYYAPFFVRNPQIMENYLINTIFRCQFPFGRDGVSSLERKNDEIVTISMSREFALLTAQFALMKGLLIGVAGCHRESFSAEHVVQTVQASSKHFEHHPEFLNLAHQLLVESQLDGARGLGILLRNQLPVAPRPATPEIRMPVPHAESEAGVGR